MDALTGVGMMSDNRGVEKEFSLEAEMAFITGYYSQSLLRKAILQESISQKRFYFIFFKKNALNK